MRYTEEQIEAIRSAIRQGRNAMARAGRWQPEVFARAFIEHGGIRIPGEPGPPERAGQVAGEVLAVLRGEAQPGDEHVAREVHRARVEARWARAARSENVVGFLLRFGPGCDRNPACLAVLGEDHGLGAGVFPVSRILVLPPGCDDYEYVPVTENEVEQ